MLILDISLILREKNFLSQFLSKPPEKWTLYTLLTESSKSIYKFTQSLALKYKFRWVISVSCYYTHLSECSIVGPGFTRIPSSRMFSFSSVLEFSVDSLTPANYHPSANYKQYKMSTHSTRLDPNFGRSTSKIKL